jgi:hypothetical protein
MKRTRATLILLAAVPLVFAVPAAAGKLGDFGAWSAHLLNEKSGRICYLYGEPKSSRGKYTKRGETYIQVTHRPAAKAKNEVGVTAGYTYRKDSEVEVRIDDGRFVLFTDGDTAWAREKNDDNALVAAMRAGRTMVVRGTSSRATVTIDTYSLTGFTAAHAAIGKACSVK